MKAVSERRRSQHDRNGSGGELFLCNGAQSAARCQQSFVGARGGGREPTCLCGHSLGPEHTQFVLFPDDPQRLAQIADTVGFALTGPQRAFLVQGDDHLGAIADIYGKLSQVEVSVYASTGITDGRGGFGYILYVRPESFGRAEEALKNL
jgi:hypothetical protein